MNIGNKDILKGLIKEYENYFYAIVIFLLMIRGVLLGAPVAYYVIISDYPMAIAVFIYHNVLLILLFLFAMLVYATAGYLMIKLVFLRKDIRNYQITRKNRNGMNLFLKMSDEIIPEK